MRLRAEMVTAGRLGESSAVSSVPSRRRSVVLWLVVAAFLAAHGAIHAVGFAATWGLGEVNAVSRTPLLVPGLAPGSPLALFLGVLWLAPLGAFLAAAAGLASRVRWWRRMAVVAAIVSLLLCAMWWSDAWFGVVVDVAVLAWLMARAGPRK